MCPARTGRHRRSGLPPGEPCSTLTPARHSRPAGGRGGGRQARGPPVSKIRNTGRRRWLACRKDKHTPFLQVSAPRPQAPRYTALPGSAFSLTDVLWNSLRRVRRERLRASVRGRGLRVRGTPPVISLYWWTFGVLPQFLLLQKKKKQNATKTLQEIDYRTGHLAKVRSGQILGLSFWATYGRVFKHNLLGP